LSARRSTEELVARLADTLVPVRPISSLRRQGIAVALAWGASAAIAAVWLSLHPLNTIARGPVSAAVFGALSLIGAAGVLLGLASRIPGREDVARAAAIGAALGAVVLLGLAWALPRPVVGAVTLEECRNCFARSLILAIPSGLLAASLARHGAPWRPRTAGIALALGASSLGALLIHASCPSPSAAHWLMAHALLPLPTGASVGLLVAWRLDRRAPRARRALALDA